MRLTLSYGREELLKQFSSGQTPTVLEVLESVKESHPKIYDRWCDKQGNLRQSLTVFVNGRHIRYLNGLDTTLAEDDEVYIIPLIAGG
jgi:molybdopterin synthase sulfur carrier subunit